MDKQRKPAPTQGSGWVLGAVIAAAVVLAALMIWAGSQNRKEPAGTVTAGAAGLAAGTALGPDRAPVKVEVFSDFQCIHCKTAATNIIAPLVRDYVEDGRVRVVFRLFPKLGRESLSAARAAVCAGQQGQFWAYHDKLFANQRGIDQGAYADARLLAWAKELGLDAAAWSRCVGSDEVAEHVAADIADGLERGVQGTPTFIISAAGRSQVIVGAVPYAEFQPVIEAALAAAG